MLLQEVITFSHVDMFANTRKPCTIFFLSPKVAFVFIKFFKTCVVLSSSQDGVLCCTVVPIEHKKEHLGWGVNLIRIECIQLFKHSSRLRHKTLLLTVLLVLLLLYGIFLHDSSCELQDAELQVVAGALGFPALLAVIMSMVWIYLRKVVNHMYLQKQELLLLQNESPCCFLHDWELWFLVNMTPLCHVSPLQCLWMKI